MKGMGINSLPITQTTLTHQFRTYPSYFPQVVLDSLKLPPQKDHQMKHYLTRLVNPTNGLNIWYSRVCFSQTKTMSRAIRCFFDQQIRFCDRCYLYIRHLSCIGLHGGQHIQNFLSLCMGLLKQLLNRLCIDPGLSLTAYSCRLLSIGLHVLNTCMQVAINAFSAFMYKCVNVSIS